MIGDSTCLNTALEEYKKIINEDAKKPAQLDIKKDLEYLMRNTVFIPFFSKDDWGVTIPAFNLSFINLDIYDLQENNNSYPDYVFLFYFIKYIISFLHEPVGHNFKIFESYNEKLETPFDTPKRTKDGRITQNEGGYLMEMLLINSVEYLNIEHVLFLLNEKNWALVHSEFLSKFLEIKEPIFDNCLNHLKAEGIVRKLFDILKINQKSIKNAIKAGIMLPTKLKERSNDDLKTFSIDEKYKKQKEKKIINTGRICRTHSFY